MKQICNCFAANPTYRYHAADCPSARAVMDAKPDPTDTVREIDRVWEAIISAPLMRMSLLTPLRDIALRLAKAGSDCSDMNRDFKEVCEENARLKAAIAVCQKTVAHERELVTSTARQADRYRNTVIESHGVATASLIEANVDLITQNTRLKAEVERLRTPSGHNAITGVGTPEDSNA